jgi:hypothetical protein
MPTVATLEEVTELARRRPRLFVRWSRGPGADAVGPASAADEIRFQEFSYSIVQRFSPQGISVMMTACSVPAISPALPSLRSLTT